MKTAFPSSTCRSPAPRRWLILCYFAIVLALLAAIAERTSAADTTITRSHGFALHGTLKYPADFKHFDYVNPDAVKGGEITLLGFGTYDTLNPYTLKGTSPFNSPGFFQFGIGELNETLLAGTQPPHQSGDEPQSAYGLIAETIEYPADFSWVVFQLRADARFHDGTAITADDVLFSFTTLVEQGHPRFKETYSQVADVEKLGPRRVKVHFHTRHSGAQILRFGELPILPAHYWKERDFTATTLEPPLLSGPYRIAEVKPGQRLVYERVNDYWGASLPVNRGRFNFDRVRVEFYRDLTVAFEAFKSGDLDVRVEYIAKNWATGYDFPAVAEGRVIKQTIPHRIPAPAQAFFFNTRRPQFDDKRVREALSLMFDFEWTQKNLFNGAYTRSASYFPNSDFAATQLPTGLELEILEPYREQLPPALFEQPYVQAASSGSGHLRQQKRRALSLLKEASWELRDNRLTHVASGQAMQIEFLIRQAGIQRVLLPYVKNLESIGVAAELRLVDAAQYKERLDQFDFDMTTFALSPSLAPSFEQRDRFHSANAAINGSRNYAGIRHPVVDALTERLIRVQDREELIATARALDRVLLWEHYTVLNWHLDHFRLAWWNKFERPAVQPPYTLGFENWWIKQ